MPNENPCNISVDELVRKVIRLEEEIDELKNTVSTNQQKLLVLDVLLRGDGDGGGLRGQVKEVKEDLQGTKKLIDEKLTPLQKFMWTIIGIGGLAEVIILPIFFHFFNK